jgi:hypothetical protein
MASVFLFVFFVFSQFVLLLLAEEEMGYTQRCPPFHCGHLGNIHFFPFANETNPECGVFTVDCWDPYSPIIQLEDRRKPYKVLNIFENNTIRVFDTQLWDHGSAKSCESFTNLTLPRTSFFSFEFATPNQTFFKCKNTLHISPPANFKNMSCNDHHIYYSNSSDSFPSSPSGCSIIQLPKNLNPLPVPYDPFDLFTAEFTLRVHVSEDCKGCYNRGGECKPGDKGELDCLGAEKGINIGITQQYLGIHIYLHEYAYKFLFPFTLYLFLTHVLLLFLFHAIIDSYKAIALADLDECQI